MSGKDLYEAYAKLQNDLVMCDVDEWLDLDEDDRLVWNALADRVTL